MALVSKNIPDLPDNDFSVASAAARRWTDRFTATDPSPSPQENSESGTIKQRAHQRPGLEMIGDPQQVQKQALAVGYRLRFDSVIALVRSVADERPHDIEEAPLIAISRNRAAQQSRLSPAGNLSWREAARRHPKHRQVGFSIADRNRLGVRPQDPVAQRRQAGSLVDALGHNGRIDRGLVERKPIEPQRRYQVVDGKRRQWNRRSLTNAE